ncbi:hypothetical protein ACPYO6_15040 [Georgenia sp. Z1344]|uniref:hypothetical protein n=1 Tax=Georgenia sp. Z1344 TaxID=3416706 RepID=UPI003CF135F1
MTPPDPADTPRPAGGEPTIPDDDAHPPAADPASRPEESEGEPEAQSEDVTDDPAEPETTPEPEKPAATTVGHIRSAPRYGRFMWTGFLLGILVSILLVVFTEGQSFDEGYAEQVGGSQFYVDQLSDSNAIGLLVLTLGPLGILLGAIVAYVLDRRSLRRRERATRGLAG